MHAEELTGVISIGVHVTNLQGKRSRNQRRKKKKARDVLEKVKGRTVGGCLSRVEANFSLLESKLTVVPENGTYDN